MMKNENLFDENERFVDFIEDLKKKGMLPWLFKYYLETDIFIRQQYKRKFKNILTEENKPGSIFVYPYIEE
jgi:hypothetical protein